MASLEGNDYQNGLIEHVLGFAHRALERNAIQEEHYSLLRRRLLKRPPPSDLDVALTLHEIAINAINDGKSKLTEFRGRLQSACEDSGDESCKDSERSEDAERDHNNMEDKSAAQATQSRSQESNPYGKDELKGVDAMISELSREQFDLFELSTKLVRYAQTADRRIQDR